ncbi:MAG: 3-phosphoshikimate 1-carboxyvinyltransferase [Clostridium sp.]|nr:3-phosphoshikimate 1-carboxyvinyltransferase [Clostridium sp.]
MKKILNINKVSGVYQAVSSKSYGHRIVIASSLARAKSKVHNIDLSEDILATIDAFKCLGVKFFYNSKTRILDIDSKEIGKIKKATINVKESGSSLRFLIPILMLFEKKFIVEGSSFLMERPMDTYFNIFKKINFNKALNEANKKMYLVKGPLKGNEYIVSGQKSSQFISGMLFALPLSENDSSIIIKDELESKNYVDMTLKVLKDYGIKYDLKKNKINIPRKQKYKKRDYTVEGDYSQASFFFAAAALAGDLTIKGLNMESLQGDKEIVNILREMGVVILKDKYFIIKKAENLKALHIDIKNIPDLAPILAVLLSFSSGEGSLYNIDRLKYKESNRIISVINLINSLGGKASKEGNKIIIKGFKRLKGGKVNSYNDHRIAMAASVASLRCENSVIIEGAEHVNKSYPDFYKDLDSIVFKN